MVSGFRMKEEPTLAALWAEISDLPLKLFHPELLKSLKDNILTFLFIDNLERIECHSNLQVFGKLLVTQISYNARLAY